MPVISVELTIFIFVPFMGINLDFSRLLDEFFVLDLYEYLGNESVEGWQYQFRAAWWSAWASIVGSLES